MTIDRARVREVLDSFDIKRLFIEELGWDHPPSERLSVMVDGVTYCLEPIAQKRGMVVYRFDAASDDALPDHPTRQKLERLVARAAHEHIIIYVDAKRTTQVWQWVRREPGRPLASRQANFHVGSSGESLIQKLEMIAFDLDEEEGLTISTVANRARQAFDVDRVTKRFYDQFRSEHSTFLGFIKGIQAQGDREWYASLMLNRLMFVYFVQKKGFLDQHTDYLRDRLRRLQTQAGKDQFHSFYRHFLLRLFHEGLGKEARSPNLDALLGRVPYLNGGLFDVHELERRYEDISIPDEAFERVFDFFERYSWHLDERPLRADNEVNPDVLGYIFEKYINQRQMGAYYTKEDITGYMCRSTVAPFLLDHLAQVYSSDGVNAASIWSPLTELPDRYIPRALLHGVDHPLPAEIDAGVSPSSLDDLVTADEATTLTLRHSWNQVAPAQVALPGETWRDVVARRAHCESIREQLRTANVETSEQLLSLNLESLQLLEDALQGIEQPSILAKFWNRLTSLRLLDPACGSGAFLFAALNVLEPLYDACVDRMEAFVADGSGDAGSLTEFSATLERIAKHPNRRYFILKYIVLSNLYGVDIMEEAVEICKLRLFLKLAAQVEPDRNHWNLGIEPLPDVDFNIRPGNSLVGYATYAEAEQAITTKLDYDDIATTIASKSAELQAAFDAFRELQVDDQASAASQQKRTLQEQLAALQDELNRYLATAYAVPLEDEAKYRAWLESHSPFHWFVEFYGILNRGGFDIIVGNPPYVEYSEVSRNYTLLDEDSRALGNLHAMMTQRALRLLAPDGSMSLIVPVALPSTDRFRGLRAEMLNGRNVWASHYDFRPAKLFEGANQRLTIFIVRMGEGALYTTRYNRWSTVERPVLFQCLSYTHANSAPVLRDVWPKLDGELSSTLLGLVAEHGQDVRKFLAKQPTHPVYYKNTGILYHATFTREAPQCFINGKRASSSRETMLRTANDDVRRALHCLLTSSTFYVVYEILSNCRDLNPSDIYAFLVPAGAIDDPTLHMLSDELHENQQANSEFRVRNQKQTGEVRLQSFKPGLSKPVLDRVDHVIARHLGLTERQLDFIISYDIKYRLGADDADE